MMNFLNAHSNSMDELTPDEREEIDLAIARSLAEEEANKHWPARGKLEEEEDEQFNRAVLKSLEVQSPPRYNQANAIRTNPLASTSRDGFCKGCNARIWQEERSLKSMGALWHPDCFLCHACRLPITDKQFSIGEDRPFHESCYKEHHHPKCDVCNNFLPRSTDGVECRTDTFWMQKYCPSHEQDGTPVCCSCTRLEPKDMEYITLDDGRKLCLECLHSVIMDSQDSQPLYCKIREFFSGLKMEVEQQIPLHLVERQALNEAMEGQKNGHHHLPETRGICLLEDQSVPQLRDPDFQNIIQNQPAGTSSWTIQMIGPDKLDRSCDVTAILILYGLPRLLTGSILAHEMMHAWLRLSGYPKLSPKVEEGICQVMAHMWLDMETGSSSSGAADSDEQLRAFFKFQIEEDSSPNYGEGFKLGHRAVQNLGLRETLDYIRKTGSFPL